MQTSSLPAQLRRARESRRCSDPLAIHLQPQSLSRREKRQVSRYLDIVETLPVVLRGKPISLEFLPGLTIAGGKLLTDASHGKPVYAASYIRSRRMVLETALLRQANLLRSILIHELFHFAWVRLGNGLRAAFSALLAGEENTRMRGSLGESSEACKPVGPGSRGWRSYVCESFCDSAAYLATQSMVGDCRPLSRLGIERRSRWFKDLADRDWMC